MSSNAQKPELNLRENTDDIGSGAAVSLDSSSLSLALSGLFKDACEPDAHDKAKRDQEKEFVINQLEQGRALVSGQITSEQVTSCVGAFMQVAINARGAETARAEAKAKSDEMMFLALLDQIRDDIDRAGEALADRYGENFAEDMLETLAEKDLVSQEELDRIRAIEDPKERRDKIGQIIAEKLESGEITMGDLGEFKDDPLVQEWLKTIAKEENMLKSAVEKIKSGDMTLSDFTQDVQDKIVETYIKQLQEKNWSADQIREAINSFKLEEKVNVESSENELQGDTVSKEVAQISASSMMSGWE